MTFDAIVPRYDLINRLLSCGRDMAWREQMARHLPDKPDLRVLDLATGTGDVPVALSRAGRRWAQMIGMDPSFPMLERAKEKAESLHWSTPVRWVRGDANHIPLRGECVDAVTVAFGVRNFPDRARALTECLRVLRPGGRLLVLEFSTPKAGCVRWAYLCYLRHIVPRVGSMLSGSFEAYRYLARSIEAFPKTETFCNTLCDAGYGRVRAYPIMLGIVTLYAAEKPDT